MSSPAGYLWDTCARHGLTFRTYGEMASFVSDSGYRTGSQRQSARSKATSPWNGCRRSERRPRYGEGSPSSSRNCTMREKTGDWPNFMVMSLGEDHTARPQAGRLLSDSPGRRQRSGAGQDRGGGEPLAILEGDRDLRY